MRLASPQSPGVSPLDMLLGPRWPAEGHMNKVDSSSLASFTSPLYRLTTPAAREEQGTSLYLRYNIPPHAPRAGSAKEATSGVFAGPAWPDFASPAVASLGVIPPRLGEIPGGVFHKTTRILVKSIPTCREYKTELACSVIELRDVFPKNRFSAALEPPVD